MALVAIRTLPAQEEDIRHMGSIPGLGRSVGGGYGNPAVLFLPVNPIRKRHGKLQFIGSQEFNMTKSDLAPWGSPQRKSKL